MADLPKPLREGEVMGAYMDFDRTADKTWTSAEYLVRFGQFVSQRTADQLEAYAAAKVAEERAKWLAEAAAFEQTVNRISQTIDRISANVDAAIRGTEAASRGET